VSQPFIAQSETVTQPIIPWPGGKRRLASKLLPLFPNHETYVEAFAGGGALLFARDEPAKTEVLNDLNGDLVNLYRVVQHHLDEFVRQFRWALSSRQLFRWAQLQVPSTLTDIQRAARFFYLQKLAFGSKVAGQTFGVDPRGSARLNLLRLEEELSAAHLRLSRVVVEALPWQDCLRRYDRPGTLFFLDPPYWQTEGYGTEFGRTEYDALAEAMRGMAGKAILTINDHPDMRLAFRGLRMKPIQTRYTIGRDAKSKAKPRGELVVFSWP
jgi:DNA adenine methylase